VAGETRRYRNPDGQPAETVTDLDAFGTRPF